MKDIELPPLPTPSMFAEYWASDMHAYARAAVEADRAQRVPDGAIAGALFDFAGFLTTLDVPVRFGSTEEAAPMVELLQEFAKKRGLSLDDADVLHWSTLLASTPAPAQQEPAKPMDAHLAAYFIRRFLHEEKMLGPNEQDALRFTIEALEVMATTHQEPPQQECKPMTPEEVLEKVLAIVRGYLPPDGMLAENAMSEIIALVDPWPFGDPKGPK